MKKSFLEIYGLAVCFFNVVCFVFVLGFATWATVRICAPKFTLQSGTWQMHQSNESFRSMGYRAPGFPDEKTPAAVNAITEARERSFAQAISAERRDGYQELVKQLLIMIINLGVFFLHWKVATHARNNAS